MNLSHQRKSTKICSVETWRGGGVPTSFHARDALSVFLKLRFSVSSMGGSSLIFRTAPMQDCKRRRQLHACALVETRSRRQQRDKSRRPKLNVLSSLLARPCRGQTGPHVFQDNSYSVSDVTTF